MPKTKPRNTKSTTKSAAPPQKLPPFVQKFILNAVLTLIVFFFVATIFNLAGSLGEITNLYLRFLFGAYTPVFGIFLIYILLRRLLPKIIFAPTKIQMLGIFFSLFGLAGIIHTLHNEPAWLLALDGLGTGLIGFLAAQATTSYLGFIVGKAVLITFIAIGLLILIHPLLTPFLQNENLKQLPSSHDNNEAEQEGDELEELQENHKFNEVPLQKEGNSSIPVVGEIRSKPLFELLKDKISVGKLQSNIVIEPASFPASAETPLAPIKRVKSESPANNKQQIPSWNYPPLSLLESIDMKPQAGDIKKRMEVIAKTLADFGIEVTMNDVNVGPTVAQYTLRPADGVRLNQITARQAELALALSAKSLRVEAPIPGKSLVGIEIPNDKKAIVSLRSLLASAQFKAVKSKLILALGRDAAGAPALADLARMPHALIAGSTGSGKSIAINSIIVTLLINNSPDELRMILVDPKHVELTGYNGLPHLLTPVITEPKDTVSALAWCVQEMERRYRLFANYGRRNLEQYNNEIPDGEQSLPFIVVVIDELADLMMVAGKEVEGSIVRLAQKARATGIHLIIATQRPSVDVITGLIKANIPTRIAFAVASQIDSRTIIDIAGAEKLLGYGDMLYLGTEIGQPKRIQGVFCSEQEIRSIIAHIKSQETHDRYDTSVLTHKADQLSNSINFFGSEYANNNSEDEDSLVGSAYEVVKLAGKASTTLLQTRLSVGYARAARLIQILEDRGLVGPANGAKPREVFGVTNEKSDFLDESLEEPSTLALPEKE